PVGGPHDVLVFGRGPGDPLAAVAVETAGVMVGRAVDFELHPLRDVGCAFLEARVEEDAAVAVALQLEAEGKPEVLVVLFGLEIAVLFGHADAVNGPVFDGPLLLPDWRPAAEVLAVKQRDPLLVGKRGAVSRCLSEEHRGDYEDKKRFA